jgi:signal transduction histidine kinase
MPISSLPERTLILAPRGRDAAVAEGILRDADLRADVCADLPGLMAEIARGADAAVVTEEAMRGSDIRSLTTWVTSQPPWSDFPFIHRPHRARRRARAQSGRGAAHERARQRELSRGPFHPTTLVSVVLTSLRGRRRQYECRRLNEELESRVAERTAELAAANRQLLAQIEERERVESTLRQMQRLEAVGQLTSGVAHDFNNLLTVVLGNIAFVERGLAAAGLDGKLTQRLGYMRAAAERGAKLTDQLLTFSRRQRLEPKAIDLNETVAGMRDLMQSTIGGSISIETRLVPGLWTAFVDPTQLELAVLNLAINARDAMQIGGTLSVTTSNVALGAPLRPEEPPSGDYVEICVADSGEGMTEEVRAKVFEPFFTTKEIGKGSGLGLSQVLGFAKQSGGGVRIDSRRGEGTSVCIYLPRVRARSVPARMEGRSVKTSRDVSANILLVDDDNAVRDVTATMLRELGYEVLEAGSGGAALDLLQRVPDIDLVLIDFAMPGMSGAELASRVRARRPAPPVLFVTGFADRAALAGVGEAQIIGKPFLDSELVEKVRLALAGVGQTSHPPQ